jgi:prolyl oligopeptidase
MKRLSSRAVERNDSQPNHLQVFIVIFPLIPLLIFAAISGLFPRPAQSQEKAANGKCPPPTRMDGTVEMIHGVSVADPYRWLEDQNSPETRAWIEVQNACTQRALKTLPGNEAITKRLTELIKVDTIGIPSERGGRYFYSKRVAGQDLFVLYMRRGTGPEEVLVDPASLSADHTTSVSLYGLSDDGKIVAYGVRKGGEDEVSVHLIDTGTRKELADTLPRARLAGVSFKSDNSGFYYSKMTDAGMRAYYHAMGTSPEQDTKLFGDGYGPDKSLSVDISENGRYLLFKVSYGSACQKSEIYFQDIARAEPITPIVKTIDSCFWGEIAGDTLYMETNWKAPNWRVLSVSLSSPAQENWKEIVPESESRLEDFRLAGGQIIALYSHNAASELKIFEADGKAAGNIALPALGDVSEITGRWRNSEAFLSF